MAEHWPGGPWGAGALANLLGAWKLARHQSLSKPTETEWAGSPANKVWTQTNFLVVSPQKGLCRLPKWLAPPVTHVTLSCFIFMAFGSMWNSLSSVCVYLFTVGLLHWNVRS
jgi:hypothetical protein